MQREANGALGAHQACASCKHQRKKCAEDCVLAPLFPADRTQDFQAVHKLFGVSNVSKLLKSIPREDDRKKAADSLVWEATCRIKDPVLGPYGEYKRILEELKYYKNHTFIQQLAASQGTGGPTVGGMVLKSGPGGSIGWNGASKGLGASNNNNNNIGPIGGGYSGIMNSIGNIPNNGNNTYMDIINDNMNGGSMMESNRIYSYPTKVPMSDKMEMGPVAVPGQAHHGNGYNNNNNHQYYLAGQYNSNMNGKTTDNNLWEDGQDAQRQRRN